MQLNEEFEVKFKDKNSAEQRNMLLNALKDLYVNIDEYNIVKRKDSNNQTSKFMDRFYITKGDIVTLLKDYAFSLNVTEWGDILDDRDRPNNLLYILYIPNAKVGNWDYTKSREKLLYIKWNPKNRNIISFHTMSVIQQTNRDKLMERKMKIAEEKFEIYNTHVKYRFINRWCNLYYDKVSENLFVLYDGYIEIVDQIKSSEFERIYDEYTLCKPTDKIIQIWKRDWKLEEKSNMNIQDVIDFVYTHTDEDFVLTDLEVLEDLKKDLKNGTKPIYDLDDVKGVKDDIVQTMELSSEQKKVLNDFMKKVEGLYKDKGKIEEKLSFAQLKSEIVPQNKAIQNLNYFYQQRNKLNGQGNRNIKFVASQFDPNEGSITFMYRTDATYNNEDKKELVNENPNDGTLRQNISDEYDLQLKICDFWEILDELIEPTDENFTKEDMKAVLELSQEVRVNCSCPSLYWTGGSWMLTNLDAQLKDCTIAPKYWNKPNLRPNVSVCKHLLSLLNHISVFLPNMAQSCKKELRNFGLI